MLGIFQIEPDLRFQVAKLGCVAHRRALATSKRNNVNLSRPTVNLTCPRFFRPAGAKKEMTSDAVQEMLWEFTGGTKADNHGNETSKK